MKDELKRILAITRSPYRDSELKVFIDETSLDDLGEVLKEIIAASSDEKEKSLVEMADELHSDLENAKYAIVKVVERLEKVGI